MRNVLIVVLAAALAAPASALETDAGIRLKLTGLGEGARDLGTTGLPETEETYFELNPEAHFLLSDNFAAHARLQGFFSTGDVVLNEDDRPVRSNRYAAVRELWLEYGGITTYPGEVLRLGLQRLRDYDGLWFDRDIESLRWIFDTTLFQAHVGIGEQLDNYRSDDVELSTSQQDRAYAWASFAREWLPGHRSGLRFAYAQDHGELPEIGSTADTRTKTDQRNLGWLGVRAENGFYDYRRSNLLSYWVEATALLGTQDSAQTDDVPDEETGEASNEVLAYSERDVAALAGDVGLRVRLLGAAKFQFGAAYAYAQGGRSRDTSNRFIQTGLHSNRSRFTGTRSLMHRFNEAYQADFSNVRVASAFMSLPLEKFDASLVFHRFARDDADSPVGADGVEGIQPTGASNDLGHGWDLVAAYYLDRLGQAVFGSAEGDGDTRSNFRLRASTFAPGAAYGSGLEDQYRVILETSLWF